MQIIFPVLFLFSMRMEKYRREERNLDGNLEEEDEAKERRTGMRDKGKCEDASNPNSP